MNEEIDPYRQALVRIAGLFDIQSPLQLIARAENNEETYIDILCKIITERLKRDSWQPIALAPKDGTRVLLCSNTRHREIALWKQSHRPLEPSGWFTDAGWWVSNATHWQPLPDPPKE